MGSRLKQLVRIADEKAHALVSPMRKNGDDSALLAYQRSVFEWKHTYAAWIEENEAYTSLPGNTAAVISNEEKKRLSRFLEGNGEWVAFCTDNGYLSAGLTEHLAEYLSSKTADIMTDNSEVGVLYGDEDYLWEDDGIGLRMCPFFKPDYSPETLLSFSYFGELIFIKRIIAETIKGDGGKVGLINYVTPLEIYELSLKACEVNAAGDISVEGNINAAGDINEAVAPDVNAAAVSAGMNGAGAAAASGMIAYTMRAGHIPYILYHRSATALCGGETVGRTTAGKSDYFEAYDRAEQELTQYLESDDNISRVLVGAGADGVKIRREALAARGLRGKLVKADEGDLYRIVYECESKVSVVILSKDNPGLLEKCISKIRNCTDYPSYEIIVVDNGSSAENREKSEQLSDKYSFDYYFNPMEFNFSALCNYGVGKSSGELILLMNDDVEVIGGDYMKLMAGLAAREGIGAVGARLRYGDGISLQHAGVTSLGIGPSHQLQKKSDNKNYYFGRNRVDYEMLGVTAACLMVRRSVYDAVGGLDEGLKVAYNDVDFCMKLAEAGYRNVQCNGALLLHHESMSRGFDGDSDEKWNRLLAEKEGLYRRHPEYKAKDPYHSVSLIDNSSEYMCSHKNVFHDFGWRSRVTEVEAADKERLTGKGFSFRITMDHSTLQRRFNPEDEDFLWIDGWVHVPGADQTCIEKKIVLDDGNGKMYEIDTQNVYRPDVADMLPAAKNIAMAGFLARIAPAEIPAGSYRVGIVLNGNGRTSCRWTDRTLVVRLI